MQWILWIMHGYAATTAVVCRDFPVTPLEPNVLVRVRVVKFAGYVH